MEFKPSDYQKKYMEWVMAGCTPRMVWNFPKQFGLKSARAELCRRGYHCKIKIPETEHIYNGARCMWCKDIMKWNDKEVFMWSANLSTHSIDIPENQKNSDIKSSPPADPLEKK